MPSTKSIKQRIKSVKNTSQITKAMEVVSATKMRKAQEFAIRARPYAVASLEMMQNLLARTPAELLPPILMPRPVATSVLLVITSDKGLAGAFNANVLKKAEIWITEKKNSGMPYAVIVVGKKAKDYFDPVRSQSPEATAVPPMAERTSNGVERRGVEIVRSFWGFGDYSATEETLPVADLLLQGFLNGAWDAADAVYTNFRTTLRQEAVMKRILPATREGLEDAVAAILPEAGRFSRLNLQPSILNPRYSYEYKFEPSAAAILEALVPQLIRMHIHHIILESNASEHSARMVAMKSASDNARELIGDLTLEFNKARQANITRELAEITAGAEALE